MRRFTAFLITMLLLSAPTYGTELKQQTTEAFDRYVRLTDQQIQAQEANHAPFLWLDALPPERRAAVLADLRGGKVVIERLETLDGGKRVDIPGGMIHHWIGTVFIPGATLAQTLALEQDYDHHQEYFRPDVVRSKIMRRDGNDFQVLLRFHKKKVVTSVLDTEHDVHYSLIDSTHAASRSRTTRVQEVENAGEADERLEPEGHDRGLLWRMNTYWRFEERDGGTYVESQSISLTRDIPTGLGWLVGPFVHSIPRESLTFTLGTTRSAVLQRIAAHPTPAPAEHTRN